MKININQFKYKHLNPKSQNPAELEYIESAYSMWKSVWSEAFIELGESGQVTSDDFTRHDWVGALFYNTIAVGSMFFSKVNLNRQMAKDDSYFKVWPQETLEYLNKNKAGHNTLVCCYFTLAKEWRGKALGFPAKEVLGALGVKTFLSTDSPSMVGTMRANKGMNQLTYKHGASALKSGVIHHGVEVDLVLYEQSVMRDFKFPEIHQIVETIWQNSGIERIAA